MNRMPRIILACAMAGIFLAGCKVADVKRQDEASRFKEYLKEQQTAVSPAVAKPLTMSDCEVIALANSLDLRLQQMSLKVSDDNVRLALTGALPKASVAYTDSVRSNDNLVQQGGFTVKAGDRHEQSAGLQATMPILDWGITYYSWQIATDQRKQNELLLARSSQLLVRDVRVAYVTHASALRREKLLQQAMLAANEVLRVARSLEKAGETVAADTSLVQATVAQAELDLALVRKSIRESKLDLAQLMSLPPTVDFQIATLDMPLPALPTAEEVQQLEDRALAARPELAVQDLQRHISAYQVKQQFAAFFPRVDGIGGFTWSGNSQLVNSSWWTGGIQVSHGLLNGGADIFRYSIAKKSRDIEMARSLLLSLGVIYDVEMRALKVRETYEIARAAESLENARSLALRRIISLYQMGMEDEAGAARALADLTIQSTALDSARREYLVAWMNLEAAALPEVSRFALAATQPATMPALTPILK